jgi:hypothetical protein
VDGPRVLRGFEALGGACRLHGLDTPAVTSFVIVATVATALARAGLDSGRAASHSFKDDAVGYACSDTRTMRPRIRNAGFRPIPVGFVSGSAVPR